jgi:putative endonuclease
MSHKGEDKNPRLKIWWVYMVRCADGTIYTGCTTDLRRRVRQHNGELRGGAKYTASRRPVRLMGTCQADDRSSAQSIEIKLKRLTRAEKLSWCESHRIDNDA